MKNVTIYTDGACSGNPGPGGWGCVLIYNNIEKKKKLSGGKLNTTNNEMEISAVINGLKALKEPCAVDIYSDSSYVVNSFKNNWIENWVQNGWLTSTKQSVKNKELWEELYSLTKVHNVTFHKVKGHADNKYNNICDELARNAIKNI